MRYQVISMLMCEPAYGDSDCSSQILYVAGIISDFIIKRLKCHDIWPFENKANFQRIYILSPHFSL